MTAVHPPVWGSLPTITQIRETVRMDKDLAKIAMVCVTILAVVIVAGMVFLAATGKDVVVLGTAIATVIPVLFGQFTKYRNGKVSKE